MSAGEHDAVVVKTSPTPPESPLGLGTPASGSYVYPVKSLLSGILRAEVVSSEALPGLVGVIGSPASKDDLSYIASKMRKGKGVTRSSIGHQSQDLPSGNVNSGLGIHSSMSEESYFPSIPSTHSLDTNSSTTSTSHLSKSSSEFMLEDNSSAKSRSRTSTKSRHEAATLLNDMSGIPIVSQGEKESSWVNTWVDTGDRSDRNQQPALLEGAETTAERRRSLTMQLKEARFDGPFDIAHKGYVHLAPIPPTSDSSRTSSSMYGSSNHSQSLISGSSRGHSSGLSLQSSTISDQEPLVSVRYEHKQDENGHHVVVGRKGTLMRCEDEPIHAPGAVQGFGVLIAVEDDEETGDLVVRQVSENASEILGLSPQYLFSLDCFTQTLPDSQADLLWDNVQFLHGSESETDGAIDYSPQVFLLSGWGEPGSATSDDDIPTARTDRKIWTCWCAAHRPPIKPSPSPGGPDSTAARPESPHGHPRNLIILEFELERDTYNPLYPPFPQETQFSGDSSPMSGSSSWGSRSAGSGSSSSRASGSNTASSTEEGSDTGNATTTQMSANQTAAADASIGAACPPDLVDGTELNPAEFFLSSKQGLEGDDTWFPSPEDLFESTTSRSKPLKALERMRRVRREPINDRRSSQRQDGSLQRRHTRARRGGQGGVGTMDIFAVLAQVNDQLSTAPDLDSFLKIVVGVIKDLTQFHRVLVYQFDEQWNGQAVAELVDWKQTHDLYKGLRFPASDIPPQARELYRRNKVRLLYDRSQTTARLVVRSRRDLATPLDMTHSYLRAMSPIHVKYLGNMGVRSSMSISIVSFGVLWGLVNCHAYGLHGMRVSFPVRQMLRLLSDSISRNVERLSYARRLHTRKLISTLPTDAHPTGYIVSNAEDLLGLFDADFGVLVIGEAAKIFGPNQRGQEVLLVAEYLRLKQFNLMQVSHSVTTDFPDLQLPSGLDVIAGLLYVPLSHGGKDFICFLRKGQVRDVHWAGKPYKQGDGADSLLEPRKSFKMWSERVAGHCRAWTDEQMETAGVLALVYGKFIEVWRQKEYALQTTQLTNLLLSNASHEVRTPLNHIINYLEMALNGSLDGETRENLRRSHTASKGLLFTINDLLDLTKLESGSETSFNEPFDLHATIEEAILLYQTEATRRNLTFTLDLADSPERVIGDAKKIRTVVANLTGNAVKYTTHGSVSVTCRKFKEPTGLRDNNQVAIEIVVSDTGCGIDSSKLESIFREFEQVESSLPKPDTLPGLGLGLAVVARIVEQLGGQLRVESRPNEGSRFTFLIPFTLEDDAWSVPHSRQPSAPSSPGAAARTSLIDSLVEALASSHMGGSQNKTPSPGATVSKSSNPLQHPPQYDKFEVVDSKFPVRCVKLGENDVELAPLSVLPQADKVKSSQSSRTNLRVLIVEDDKINRTILGKRLTLDGHEVVNSTNGQEGVEAIENDQEFDCILMDIQMPILNGFGATERIRALEKSLGNHAGTTTSRLSKRLNSRIPIFAVSASLSESQRSDMLALGMDGWILKPIDFKRLRRLLSGIQDPIQRAKDVYGPGCSWEAGGWLWASPMYPTKAFSPTLAAPE